MIRLLVFTLIVGIIGLFLFVLGVVQDVGFWQLSGVAFFSWACGLLVGVDKRWNDYD